MKRYKRKTRREQIAELERTHRRVPMPPPRSASIEAIAEYYPEAQRLVVAAGRAFEALEKGGTPLVEGLR